MIVRIEATGEVRRQARSGGSPQHRSDMKDGTSSVLSIYIKSIYTLKE